MTAFFVKIFVYSIIIVQITNKVVTKMLVCVCVRERDRERQRVFKVNRGKTEG
jgi:hypothetical protein